MTLSAENVDTLCKIGERTLIELLQAKGEVDYHSLDCRSTRAAESLETRGLVVIRRRPPLAARPWTVALNTPADPKGH